MAKRQTPAEHEPEAIAALLKPGAATQYHPYQALRLLEAFGVSRGAPLLGDVVQDLGRSRTAEREIIRLRPTVSMAFPPASLESVERDPAAHPSHARYQVTVSFGGLYGVDTPLPLWMAQEVVWAGRQQPALRAFLDIFHHRLLSLRYRAWRQHRYEYSFERGGRDRLSRILMGMVALSPEQTVDQLGASPLWLFRYFGLLLLRNRPASALTTLLKAKLRAELPDEPQLEVSYDPLPSPRWIRIPDEQVTSLRPGQSVLGKNTPLGRSIQDRSTYIRFVLGVVSFRGVQRLQKGPGGLLTQLATLCRFYLRQPLDLSFQVQVPADEVPKSSLGRRGGTAAPPSIPAMLSSGIPAFLGQMKNANSSECDANGRALVTFTLPMLLA